VSSASSPNKPIQYQRNAFAPSILAAIACLAGISLLTHDYYFAVRFVIAILAIIVAWFAVQAKQWWWVPVMLAIAVAWNPVYPFGFAGPWWVGAHVVAAATFIAAGALIRTVRRPV
jgi:hypothetical protein